MSMPQLVVKAGFGYGPTSAGVVYTDLSSRVRGAQFQITRGRSGPLADYDAGTAVGTLSNDDGWLDPDYNSSPYWPNVQPDTPLMVQAIYGGVTYDLIKAFVERWTPTRVAQHVADMPITASDILAPLNGWTFPLHDDGVGAGSGRKLVGTYRMHKNTFTQKDSFAGTDEAVRMYALCDASPLSSGPAIGHSDTLVFGVKYTNGSGTSGREGKLEIKYPEMSAHPHHKHRWQRTIEVALQGNDTVGSVQSIYHKSGKFYGKDLVVRLYGERAILKRGTGDAQLTSLLKLCGLAAPTVRHTGRFTQIPTSPWGGNVIDALRTIAQTEIGQIYADRHGNVVFEDRDWRYNNWGSPTTWHDGATAGTSPYIYVDCQPSLDRDNTITRWEVTRASFGPRDMPQKQVAGYGSAKFQIVGQRTPNLVSDDRALAQAKYLLARTKLARTRIASMLIKPLANPDRMFPKVLAMELGDPIIVNRYIPIAGQLFHLDSIQGNIEHLMHTVTNEDWQTNLEVSARVTTAYHT
jgi:hypothetical protein